MCVLNFSAILFKTFLITTKIQQDISTNLHIPSRRVPFFLVKLKSNLYFLDRFLKNTQISDLMKNCLAAGELLHADRQTDI
jgi:hypothetical protein